MATKSKSKKTVSKKVPKKLKDLNAKKNPKGGPSSAVVSLGKLGRVE